jgi:predicted nucleic acid-binding protein
VDQSDQWHALAEQAFARLRATRSALTTTTVVMLECGNAAARRPYRHAVDDLRQRLAEAQRLVAPTEADFEVAWAAYRRGEADQAGVVDHVSFAVMRRLGLLRVFGNDRHFRAAGVETLF